MKTLWTPWRMEHVLGKAPRVEGCLFEPPGESHYDLDYLLLYRDNGVVVLLNRFPYANGHLLIAPVKHVSCVTQLTPEDGAALINMVQKSTDILKRLLSPHGLNIGCNIGEAAGAGIADHLHFHIIPRWNGDHNFMTPMAEVRTIPEHIQATFELLLPTFQDLHSQQNTPV